MKEKKLNVVECSKTYQKKHTTEKMNKTRNWTHYSQINKIKWEKNHLQNTAFPEITEHDDKKERKEN